MDLKASTKFNFFPKSTEIKCITARHKIKYHRLHFALVSIVSWSK